MLKFPNDYPYNLYAYRKYHSIKIMKQKNSTIRKSNLKVMKDNRG